MDLLHHLLLTSSLDLNNWLYGTRQQHGHGLAILALFIIGVLFYTIGGVVVGKIVSRFVRTTTRHRNWHKKDIEKRQKTLVALCVNVWRIIVTVIVVYSMIREIEPNIDKYLTPLFASAGIIGVALGFGAQSIIKDFLSGLFIITENQYRVGDIVDIDGSSGTVERIGTRSTVIRDVDGNVHYFPNGMITHVINKTMGYSMARFIISVVPSTDIEKVTQLINTIGKELAQEDKWHTKVIDPPAFVSIGELTGTSVQLIIAGKTQPSDQWAVIAEMRQRLLEAFETHHIELATVPNVTFAPTKNR